MSGDKNRAFDTEIDPDSERFDFDNEGGQQENEAKVPSDLLPTDEIDPDSLVILDEIDPDSLVILGEDEEALIG